MASEPAPPPAADPRPLPDAIGNPIATPERSILQAAWLAIALGLAIEGLILASSGLFGGAPGARPATADLVQKVSWSLVLCVALAIARTASRASGVVLGLTGLLAAPLAFAIARGLHKGAAQALGLVAAATPGPSPLLIAGLKGLEYALLGMAVAWVARRPWGGFAAHAAAGGAAALLFGVPILALMLSATPGVTAAGIAARAVNELLVPVGCALVLYASDTLGRRLGG